MPRVNWYLSPEAKAIFEAFKLEKGLGQDDAANEILLEFGKMKSRTCKKCNGKGFQRALVDGIEFQCDICTNCKGAGYV